MKPSVGILIRALDLGGAEKQSLLQAKLMQTDFNVFYFVQKNEPKLTQHLKFIEREKINYIQLSGGYISRTKQLVSYLKKHDIKVLYAYLTTDNILAAIVSLFFKIKYIGGIRNSFLPYPKYVITRFVCRYLFDFTIFNNQSGRDLFVEKGFQPHKSVVIHNCIDHIQEELMRNENGSIKILSVGRFAAQKDYLTALKAISLVKNKFPDKKIEYTIVGDGELEQQIQKWIDDLQLTYIRIVKLPDNINKYYIEADIFLLSSIFEGLPNTIMEALNFSLPIVTTNVGDVNYLVKNGINGYVCNIHDDKMLAEKLCDLISDPEKRSTFGRNGHTILKRDFSEKTFQEKYINFTKEILKIHP